MQQLITGLLLVVQIQLNMFRASSCPSSGAYQLQQQPLVYRRNVVVAVDVIILLASCLFVLKYIYIHLNTSQCNVHFNQDISCDMYVFK